MSKFKVGDKVVCIAKESPVYFVEEMGYMLDRKEVLTVEQVEENGVWVCDKEDFFNGWYLEHKDIELYKTPQERLFDLGFEKVAKHKYVKHHKGGSGYDTPYKITIEFAFNSYQVKCEGENWVGVDLELAEILLDYLEELENE